MNKKPDQVETLIYCIRTGLGLILALGILSPFSAYAASTPANPSTSDIDDTYRHGDMPWHTDFPICDPIAIPPQLGSVASCAKCCSVPDVILEHQFAGPDPLGDQSLDEWYLDFFFDTKLGTKISEVNRQVVAAIKTETAMFGSFFDASNNLKAQGDLQRLSARSANNYQSSEALCRFATLSQSLGASEANSNAIRLAMADRSIERQTARLNTAAGGAIEGEVQPGQQADKYSRWDQYIGTFCDPNDFAQGRSSDPQGICTTTNANRSDRDIDFIRTVAVPDNLDLQITEPETEDVGNVNALANNLYAQDIVNNAASAQLLDPTDSQNDDNIRKQMLQRSSIAKHAVAENSFASIVAMKASGTVQTTEYFKKLLLELGLSQDDVDRIVKDNPSYYTQMEILTKKLYQTPTFYINLVENPVAVRRQQAAMKSFELMQQRDIYKSMARTEMLMAVLLEIYASREAGATGKRSVESRQR